MSPKPCRRPVAAIVAMDVRFYEKLPKLFPHADARSWFKDLPENVLETMALRNSSLQGAYLMLAARSLGLDCGPMSGFNNAKVDAGVFCRHHDQVEFPLLPGLRRRQQAVSPLAAARLRRGLSDRVRLAEIAAIHNHQGGTTCHRQVVPRDMSCCETPI